MSRPQRFGVVLGYVLVLSVVALFVASCLFLTVQLIRLVVAP